MCARDACVVSVSRLWQTSPSSLPVPPPGTPTPRPTKPNPNPANPTPPPPPLWAGTPFNPVHALVVLIALRIDGVFRLSWALTFLPLWAVFGVLGLVAVGVALPRAAAHTRCHSHTLPLTHAAAHTRCRSSCESVTH